MSDSIVTVAVGDSTTFQAVSWFYQANNIPSNLVYGISVAPRKLLRFFPASNRVAFNMALSGWTISNLEAQAAELDAFINQSYTPGRGRPVRHNILAVRIGTNLQNADPVVSAARVRDYCLARQAAGWKVIICPIWSKISYDTSYVQPQNAIFATWGESDGVAAVVPSTNPLLYGTGAYLNTTYFDVDGIHPTSAAHAIAASEYSSTLETLISQLAA